MPYKRKGKTIYVKKGGRWRKKGSSKTLVKAKAYLRVLKSLKK